MRWWWALPFVLLPLQPVWFGGIAALIGLYALIFRLERAWFVVPLALFALLGAASQLLGPADLGLKIPDSAAEAAPTNTPIQHNQTAWHRAGWWLGTAVMAGLAMVGSRAMLKQSKGRLPAWGLALGLSVGLFVGLVQALSNPLVERVAGFTANPNFYGIGAAASAALAALLGGAWPGGVALLLGTGIATLSGSRAAWLGLLVAAVLVLAHLPPRWRYAGLLGAVGVALTLTYGIGLPEQLSRLATVLDPGYLTNQSRLEIWEVAWQAFSAHPLTGIGLGGFQSYYQVHQPPDALDPHAPHAHNLLLGLMAESGILGLAGFLVLWGSVWRYLWRARAWLALGLIGVVALVNMVDSTWFAADVHYVLWAAVAWGSLSSQAQAAWPQPSRTR